LRRRARCARWCCGGSGTRSFPAVPYPEGVGPQLDQRCRTGFAPSPRRLVRLFSCGGGLVRRRSDSLSSQIWYGRSAAISCRASSRSIEWNVTFGYGKQLKSNLSKDKTCKDSGWIFIPSLFSSNSK
jgi:hypothetical protein